jgi:serine/threonine protein kinase
VDESLEKLAQSFTFSVSSGEITELSGESIVSDTRPLLRAGEMIDSKYTVRALIGQGGMGAIYKVHHVMLKKEMALKTFRSQSLSWDSWQRFQREAQAIAKLSHKNIVDVFDFGITKDGLPYYTMELLDGESLADVLKKSGRLPPYVALKIFGQVADALAHAHRQNIVHRDIKPANIILVGDPSRPAQLHVKLVDFGIAKLAESKEKSSDQALTQAGTVFGSPLYMSPEQSLGISTDPRTDMYSLGCALYETLIGKPPFIGNTALITILHHQRQNSPKLKDSGLGLVFPARLEAVIAKLLAKQPEDRFQDCGEVAKELDWCRRALAPGRPIHKGSSLPSPLPANTKVSASREKVENSFKFQSKKTATTKYIFTLLAVACLYLSIKQLAPKLLALVTTFSNHPTVSAPQGAVPYLLNTTDKGRTFRFPPRFPVGQFAYADQMVDCAGDVTVPKGAKLVFIPDDEYGQDAKVFAPFGSDDLYGVKLPWKSKCPYPYMKAISRLTGLRKLDISAIPDVGSESVPLIDNLKNLKYLDVGEVPISANDLIKLKVLPQIEILSASSLTDVPSLIDFLASHAVHTRVLFVNETNIGGYEFAKVTRIKTLISFSAANNHITTKDINAATIPSQWQVLNLRQNMIGDGAIDTLSKLKNLRYLNLSESGFSKNGRKVLKSAMPKCEILDLNEPAFNPKCASIIDGPST